MRRREFITLLGGAAAWPMVAHAQQSDRMRRIAVLQLLADDDPEFGARRVAFEHALQELGWTGGRSVRIDYRSAKGDANQLRKYAAELIALGPDVILSGGSITVAPVLRATGTHPGRVRASRGPGWRRPSRKLGASRRQCDRLYLI